MVTELALPSGNETQTGGDPVKTDASANKVLNIATEDTSGVNISDERQKLAPAPVIEVSVLDFFQPGQRINDPEGRPLYRMYEGPSDFDPQEANEMLQPPVILPKPNVEPVPPEPTRPDPLVGLPQPITDNDVLGAITPVTIEQPTPSRRERIEDTLARLHPSPVSSITRADIIRNLPPGIGPSDLNAGRLTVTSMDGNTVVQTDVLSFENKMPGSGQTASSKVHMYLDPTTGTPCYRIDSNGETISSGILNGTSLSAVELGQGASPILLPRNEANNINDLIFTVNLYGRDSAQFDQLVNTLVAYTGGDTKSASDVAIGLTGNAPANIASSR
jgi:hypothetical protein